MTVQDVDKVNARFRQVLKRQGLSMHGIYYCPHHPDRRCDCRKPGLSLVRRAARDLKRPWRGSVSVGDKWSDVALGQKTGGKGILVLTGIGRRSLREKPARGADFVARDFAAAARWIAQTIKE